MHSPPRKVTVKDQQVSPPWKEGVLGPDAAWMHAQWDVASSHLSSHWRPACLPGPSVAHGGFLHTRLSAHCAPTHVQNPDAPPLSHVSMSRPWRKVAARGKLCLGSAAQDWKIPPCISNWKNIKGYTIPLDKRRADILGNWGGVSAVHLAVWP